jgi:hypothetical protein
MTFCKNAGTTRPAGLRATRIWSTTLDYMIRYELGMLFTFGLSLEKVIRVDPKIHAGDFKNQLFDVRKHYRFVCQLTNEGCFEDTSTCKHIGYGGKALTTFCVLSEVRLLEIECTVFE